MNDTLVPLRDLNWISYENRRELKKFSYGVYCIRDKTNGKLYVGITTGSIYARIRGHIGMAVHHKKSLRSDVHKAIRTNGVENFEFAVVETLNTAEKDQLVLREIQYVKEYDSFNSGYNMTPGGESNDGVFHSHKTRQRISEKRKNVPCPEILKEQLRKPVQQLDKQTLEVVATFDSVTDAIRATGINNIGICCKGRIKSAGGYAWKFVHEEHKTSTAWSKKAVNKAKDRWEDQYKDKYKPVAKIDLNSGEVIKTYSSIKEARADTGVVNINACSYGTRKSAGGFLWRFIAEDGTLIPPKHSR